MIVLEVMANLFFPLKINWFMPLFKGDGAIFEKSDNPVLLIQPRKNFSGLQENKTVVFINAYGFRSNYEINKTKSSAFRILVLGDSVTWGAYMNQSDVFTIILEEKLNRKKCCFEVINAGVGGYNTIQELELLKKEGLSFDPDLLIVQFDFTDTRETKKGIINGTVYIGNPDLKVPIIIKLPFGIDKTLSKQSRAYQVINIGLANTLYRKKILEGDIELYDPYFDKTKEAINEIKQIAYSNNMDLLFIITPSTSKPRALEEERIIKELNRLNITYIDFDGKFREEGFDKVFVKNDNVHPNKEGHNLIADGLFEWLTNNHYI
jgi:lysophospholipase L1-like esterase